MKKINSLKGKQMLSAVMAAMLLASGITPAYASELTEPVAVEAEQAEAAAAKVVDIRILVNGQEVSMENPLEVHGYHKGTVTVQAKMDGAPDFVNIPSIWDAKLKCVSGDGEIRGNGIFEIMGVGESVFSASYGGITKQFKVISKNIDVTGLRVNVPATWAIHDWNGLGGYYVGINKGNDSSRQYNYVIEPGNASDKSIVWESLTPDVAEFMEAFGNGIIPKKAGTARFKVSSKSNPSVSQEVSVNFVYKNPLKSATVEHEVYTVEEGEISDIIINTMPQDASEQRFEWVYSTPGVVKISDSVTTDPNSVTIPKKTTHTMEALAGGEVTVTGNPMDTTAGCAPVTFKVKVNKKAVPQDATEVLAMAKEGIAKGLKYLQTQPMNKYGNEWSLFTTLRAGGYVSQEVKDQYYASVVAKLKAGTNNLKNTDGARIAITLAAMGKDLTNVDGVNLMEAFYNDQFKFKIAEDSSNGPIWALIALDAQKTVIPENAVWNRAKIIDQILKFQKPNGGFGLQLSGTVTSADMTGMALQALAPYNNSQYPAVSAAFNRGLEYFRNQMTVKAGFTDLEGGKETPESGAQVLVALTAAGIDPISEKNGFTKKNYNIINNLDSYKTADGFAHVFGGKTNMMATTQVTYAMEAYRRFAEGKNSLYDFSDISVESSADQKAANAVIEKIAAIGKVTLESKAKIQDARAAYEALTATQKKLVNNVDILAKAEADLKKLEDAQAGGTEVIVTVEKFTIGRGYQIEPVKVTLGKEDEPKKILKKVAGAAYKEGMFSRFKGIEDPGLTQDNITVPLYISEKLNGPTTASAIAYAKKQSSWDTIIGEDDFAKYSKWTCMINNAVLKGGYYFEPTLEGKLKLKQGDIIRFQFSIAEGQDIDGIEVWTENNKLIDISNKDELIRVMADVNADRAKWMAVPEVKAAYDEAVTAISAMITPQQEIDALTAKLRSAMENVQPEVKGHVTISVERFTIGQGYYKEPVKVPFVTGDTAETLLKKAIGADNLCMDYSNGAYLAAIKNADLGIDHVQVPEYITTISGGKVTTETAKKTGNDDMNLGEFDYSRQSGWMYHVNGKEVNYGIGDYEPKDGDVLRFQFTLYGLGTDLTGYEYGNDQPIIEISNKDELTKTMAEINELRKSGEISAELEASYKNAMLLASKVITPKKDIDEATAELKNLLAGGTFKDVQAVEDQIKAIGEVTLESLAKITAAEEAYDKLPEYKKAFVANHDVLKAARATYNKLEDEAGKVAADQAAATGVIEKIEALKPITIDKEAAVQAARKAYEMLTKEQKAYVSEKVYKELVDAEKTIAILKEEANAGGKTAVNSKYKISITGDDITDNTVLEVKPLTKNDASVKAMQKAVTSDYVITKLYHLSILKDGKEAQLEKEASLAWTMGEKYNGKTLTVLSVINGKVEKLTGKVENGILTVKVAALGDFGVVLEAKNAGGQGKPNQGQNGTNQGTVQGLDGVQTGDGTPVAVMWSTLFSAAALALLVAFEKSKRNSMR